MKVEQKSYAQIVVATADDFVSKSIYKQYELTCPFMCFPKIIAPHFRAVIKYPEMVNGDKDFILLLEDYWVLLNAEEKKAILDHELGHITAGHLKEIERNIIAGTHVGGVKLEEEKEADNYSVELNGVRSIHNALEKTLQVMLNGYKKYGVRMSIDQVLARDPILRTRLKILANEEQQ